MRINRGNKQSRSKKMLETLSESSWKSKDVCYFAITSKNVLLKKTKQQQRAMSVVRQNSHYPLTQACTLKIFVKITLLLTRNGQTSD